MDKHSEKTGLAVYTAIFGGYDVLASPPYPNGVDHVAFTDAAGSAPAPWRERMVAPPHSDPRKAARYYFARSCRVLPEYEITIMHGGNVALSVPPEALLRYVRKTPIAAFLHPHRDNVYDEPEACVALGKDVPENMAEQVERYREEGFPGTSFSACILLVRRNTPEVQAFEDLWWQEIFKGSARDQLSFDYARWKTGLPITYIPGDCFNSPYLSRRPHAG